MNIVGLDLSLTSTGVALPDGTTRRLMAPRLTGMERLVWLRQQIADLATDADLIIIEGYAMGSKRQSHSYATGELGGVIRLWLHEHHVRYVEAAPASLKKYATGKGNASKDEVLVAAVKRLGYDGACNDEADALWLRAMAHEAYGLPVVEMPAVNKTALAAISWPNLDERSAA